MHTDTPNDALFTALSLAGVRQRDVARFLHKGKSLVSQWRSGRVLLPLHSRKALMDWVTAIAEEKRRTLGQLPVAERPQALHDLQDLVDAIDAANAEADPAVWHARIALDVAQLGALVIPVDKLARADMATIKSIEDLGRRIHVAARLWRTQTATQGCERD